MEKEVLNLILVEVQEMKGDMSEVKTRLTNIEGRLTNGENVVSEIKERLTNVETDMSEAKKDVIEVKERLKNVEELAEFNQETCQSIKNVVTSHYMEFKKYVKTNDVQHNLYNAKILKYNKNN